MNKSKSKSESKIKNGFWLLAKSLNSKVKLTNEHLREARNTFSKNWVKT